MIFVFAAVVSGCSDQRVYFAKTPKIVDYTPNIEILEPIKVSGVTPHRLFIIGNLGDEMGKEKDLNISVLEKELNRCGVSTKFAFIPIEEHTLSLDDNSIAFKQLAARMIFGFKPDYILQIKTAGYASAPELFKGKMIVQVSYLVTINEAISGKEVWRTAIIVYPRFFTPFGSMLGDSIANRLKEVGIISSCPLVNN